MITISKGTALNAINKYKVPPYLRKKGITIIMPKAHAKRWLKKLEDGTQKQIESALYDRETGGFCCLGLEQACNWGGKVESDQNGPWGIPNGIPSLDYLKQEGKGYFNEYGDLSGDPYFPSCDKSASAMNDDGAPFKEIAAVIRKHIAVY